MKNVLIGGIGNVLLGDDGVGPYLARILAANYDFGESVEVIDLGTPALDLVDEISGRDAVILIDSVKTDDPPGTIRLYRKKDITQCAPQVRMDPHSPALVETLLAVDLFGTAPPDVLLVGIVGDQYGPGCSLSPVVNASLGEAIEQVLDKLDRLGVIYQRREQPAESGIWWSACDEALPHSSRELL
jgi:hydrogenase maturation protease